MVIRRHARTAIALVAAYAVALQTILLALVLPAAGTAAFAAQPICAASEAVGTGSVPAGHAHDCLATCLTGCCGTASAAPPIAAIVLAPQAAPAPASTLKRVATLRPLATGAHRSRAPPRA